MLSNCRVLEHVSALRCSFWTGGRLYCYKSLSSSITVVVKVIHRSLISDEVRIDEDVGTRLTTHVRAMSHNKVTQPSWNVCRIIPRNGK